VAVDVRTFWERKILGWEGGRYREGVGEPGLLNRLADWSSDSLRFRVQIAGELLAPHVAGRRVVDLGCGSGLLAPALVAAGAAHVHGVDIAEAAIERARARAAEAGIADRTSFERASIDELGPLHADVVVSLGLTDWLDDAGLDRMFALSGGADFLHAISERRATPAQALHRAYCWAAYGWRTGGYVPRYFRAADFAAIALRHRPGPVRIWRHRRLSFGALLTTLPLGEDV
jgi:SAM-dependent methyltransferase